jgi:hypothetical protein
MIFPVQKEFPDFIKFGGRSRGSSFTWDAFCFIHGIPVLFQNKDKSKHGTKKK